MTFPLEIESTPGSHAYRRRSKLEPVSNKLRGLKNTTKNEGKMLVIRKTEK